MKRKYRYILIVQAYKKKPMVYTFFFNFRYNN